MKRYLFCGLALAGLLLAREPGIPSYQQLHFPPLPPVKMPHVAKVELPNGMKLYLMEDHELPLVGGFALIRTGNLFDPPDKIGLATFTGEVLRSGGTRTATGDQLDQELEDVAASVESSIGETSGIVSFDCMKENTGEVLRIFKDVLTEPAFREDKLELTKTQYRSLISRRNDDAGEIASREFADIVYGRHTPYGWRMEYADIDRIQRKDLVAFYRRYYFPANIILAIRGDFSAPAMKARIEKLFADWTVKQPPVPPFPKVEARPAPGIHLAVKKDVNQAFFRLGQLGGILRDKDYPALEVMADILGGGFSSRLFKKVRTELGYAYGIGAVWGARYDHPGLFQVYGSTKSASITATLQVVRNQIERLRREPVTDAELETAKETVLNSFVFHFDRPSKTLNRLVVYDYHGYPKDFIFRYQKAVAAVTKADVLRVARQYLKPKQFTIVVVGNPAKFGRPLAELKLPISPIDLTIPEPPPEMGKTSAAGRAKGRRLMRLLQQAVGGAAKLAAVHDTVRFTRVTIRSRRGSMQVTQKNQWLAPSYFRQDQRLPFGTMTAYFDGKTGWLATPRGLQPMPPPVVRQVRGALLRNPVRLFLADRVPGWTVDAVGDNVLAIRDGAGESLRLYLDPRTHLPRKAVYRSVQMAGPPARLTDTYSDWREVNGIKLPFRITTERNGKPFADDQVSEIRLNTGLTVQQLSRKPTPGKKP